MTREPGWEPDQLSQAVIGAAIAVHRELGPGYLEALYEEALALELSANGVSFVRQAPVAVRYRDAEIGHGKLDLLVEHRLIVELKAVEVLSPIHTAQMISYLKATGLKTGLLINFNVAVLKDGVRRISL
ncbi:MAG: GxxExxY protein [Anaerolinea sp.]|nr:GxxExxY protein [Anaerolinea sp.]